ncbi:N-acyl homoserine lactonase family protein [Roseomonas marmotae]|uniref:N-acyl homoserine lactonase family protein n=1 Tax=Roseomonas marmotae TaxID=2768161 RepID=A0ABS3KDD0_9PROT|nr:N-acyl homoserine lactonase family protein [Roseomonas marmotae]MBO1075002.1 N-acyl homoserine lactonase family protein [Roseomonas marmotae]QTI79962.1 N-acyl homoserine lactonase family protein [Roseomonas marmotae]
MWEVFALRYAHHEDRPARMNFLQPTDPHDAPMPMDYFVWLLRDAAGREIVVDTGFSPEVSAARQRGLTRTVPEVLNAMGTDPATVGDIILTHLHYDHAGNIGLFPKARFHLQEQEMGFATGRHMCAGCLRATFEVEDVVAMVRALYADRVEFHEGDGEVAPGVTVHRVGGHTPGLQMVRVRTERGPLVLASDAAHYYANMQRGNPFPIVFDLGEMTQGWRRARRLAEGDESLIIPGHDPEVLRRFPKLPGSGGEVACLHLPPLA